MSSLVNLKPNIGVYTDPQHNLWIDEADPSVADIQSGATPAEGEVVVEIRSTGICGCVSSCKTGHRAPTLHACAAQMCTSGMLGG
jgi:threonine dehydrogenase-like Zn-dependent dehydrogenase